MTDYYGTDENDEIDASELDSDISNIYPKEGDDIVKNANSSHTIISGPGDDNYLGLNFGYALWNAQQSTTVNLKEGWADDGFGTRDKISGVITVHGSGNGHNVYGTAADERFFANGGNNFFEGGGGIDRISYAGGNSKNYKVTKIGDEVHIEKISGLFRTQK